MYNRISSSDIADGIKIYKEREETRARLDAHVANGGTFSAPYSYFTYILHVAIAFATGFVASLFIGTGLGVICGIVSFIISFIIHWIRESRTEHYGFSVFRASFIKRIILYTVITAAIVITIKIIA